MAVELHPEALAEYQAAVERYFGEDPRSADRFVTAIEDAFARIVTAPDRWPRESADTRRVLVRRFPFKVVYIVEGARIVILAVAHQRPRPGY